MTNAQLYLAIGIPSVLVLINMAVTLFVLNVMNQRISRVEERLNNLIGAMNELDKRLIRVEIKLGIQP